MQIDQIVYERRVSDSKYGNRLFHASATLDENEDVLTAAATVRAFVADQIERDITEEREREEAERQRRQEEYERKRQERLNAVASSIPQDDPIPFDGEEDDDE